MSGNPYFLGALFLLGVLCGALGVFIWLYRSFRFVENAQHELLCQLEKFYGIRAAEGRNPPQSRWSPAAQETYQDILGELRGEPKLAHEEMSPELKATYEKLLSKLDRAGADE